ncbi:DUF3168 domain-containing protein [Methanosarcina acetivorans]|uniref:DUF3168 domain-containing protein n=1 Tax=Methanosarcina acetivorans (strain ATCC 35395 / DSM 2834 / JCM 12185 / C2A) TaxID=188937 RepID=Q8TJH5_METAC|nr:DUF3168 domain-containing protein [Methanosarcina acetivorans]AAM07160.1 predicted protein [Methanosarcina acetivorans C2A]
MTIIDEAVRTILMNDATVTGFVGTRIFPKKLPLTCTFPAISIHKPSNPYNQISRSPRFQISCWTEDYLQVQQLSKAVEAALEGFSGIVSGIEIIRIIPLDAPDQDEDLPGVYHIPYDFRVIFRR